MKLNWMPFLALPLLASGLSVAVSIHQDGVDGISSAGMG